MGNSAEEAVIIAFCERARKVAKAIGCSLVGFDHHSRTISVGGQPGMDGQSGYHYGYEIPPCVFDYVEAREAERSARPSSAGSPGQPEEGP